MEINWLAAVIAFAVGLALVGTFQWRQGTPAVPLTDKDVLLLADFTNTTGDPVFDDTLRQGLMVQLQQSPFLSLISDQRIRSTLPLMNQPADARLTPDIARGVCVRTASAAVLEGSIAMLGSQYVLGLRATNCATGDILAFVSKPGYDPNLFVEGIDAASWEALNNDPSKPLNNRAVTGAYPPGSTFKPFVYGAALEEGMSPNKRFVDRAVEIPLPDGTVWRPSDVSPPSGRPMTARVPSFTTIGRSMRIGCATIASRRSQGVRSMRLLLGHTRAEVAQVRRCNRLELAAERCSATASAFDRPKKPPRGAMAQDM